MKKRSGTAALSALRVGGYGQPPVGVIGRTMTIAASRRKIKLVMNRTDEMGKYFCNHCGKYYD